MKSIVSCPGKVLIAGGYSILNPQNHGISLAVQKRFKTALKQTPSQRLEMTLRSAHFDQNYVLDGSYETQRIKNPYIQAALEVVKDHILRHQDQRFEIEILGDDSFYGSAAGHKIGLGSSACLLVSLLGHFIQDKEELLAAAQRANLIAQGNLGSGFDIRTAIFGSQYFSQHASESLLTPPELGLTFVRIDRGNSTVESVKLIKNYFAQNPRRRDYFEHQSEEVVSQLRHYLIDTSRHRAELRKLNARYRKLQQEISLESGFMIEPKEARELLDSLESDELVWGVCPGAGGYDAVALLVEKQDELRLSQKLLQAYNYEFLQTCVDKEGVKKEEVEVKASK